MLSRSEADWSVLEQQNAQIVHGMAPSHVGSNPQSDEYNNDRSALIRRPIRLRCCAMFVLAFAKLYAPAQPHWPVLPSWQASTLTTAVIEQYSLAHLLSLANSRSKMVSFVRTERVLMLEFTA